MQFLKRFITYLFSYGGAPLTLGCSSFDTKAVLAHSEQSSRFSNLRYQTASAIPSPHTRIGAAASARSTSPAHSAANSMGQSLFQNVYQNATKPRRSKLEPRALNTFNEVSNILATTMTEVPGWSGAQIPGRDTWVGHFGCTVAP